jgi:hypothetical protein
MNHFFFETHSKEKVESFRREGMRSQVYYRSGVSNGSLRSRLLQLTLITVVILSILQIVVR